MSTAFMPPPLSGFLSDKPPEMNPDRHRTLIESMEATRGNVKRTIEHSRHAAPLLGAGQQHDEVGYRRLCRSRGHRCAEQVERPGVRWDVGLDRSEPAVVGVTEVGAEQFRLASVGREGRKLGVDG
jgi:hypothetical protein